MDTKFQLLHDQCTKFKSDIAACMAQIDAFLLSPSRSLGTSARVNLVAISKDCVPIRKEILRLVKVEEAIRKAERALKNEQLGKLKSTPPVSASDSESEEEIAPESPKETISPSEFEDQPKMFETVTESKEDADEMMRVALAETVKRINKENAKKAKAAKKKGPKVSKKVI